MSHILGSACRSSKTRHRRLRLIFSSRSAIADEEGRSQLVRALAKALATFRDYCFGEEYRLANEVDAPVSPEASYPDSFASVRKYFRSSGDP